MFCCGSKSETADEIDISELPALTSESVAMPMASVPRDTLAGLYTDPNHYQEGTWAGLRMISSPGKGDKSGIITIIGSDDGKTFWMVTGVVDDASAKQVTVDFSPKGGPKITGTVTRDTLKWDQNNFWLRVVATETLNIPFQAADGDPGGPYNDGNHFERDSVIGLRFVSIRNGDKLSNVITIIITNDGVNFDTVQGKYTSGSLDVDFSPLGGPKSLKGTYKGSRISWANGHYFFNLRNELEKLCSRATVTGDNHISKKVFMQHCCDASVIRDFPFLQAPLQAYGKSLDMFRDVEGVMSDRFHKDDFIEYMKACLDVYKDGTLKHKQPELKYFEPGAHSKEPVLVKEIRLPAAAETHEVFFEPVTKYVFVAQMAESVLIRTHLGHDGLLSDRLDAYYVGEIDKASGRGISGLHNLSPSYRYKGHFWASIQFANTLLLLDAESLHVRKVIMVPTVVTLKDGSVVSIGGPHCIRECEVSGRIWVCLKGPLACNPVLETEEIKDHHGGIAARQAALKRPCCSPDTLKKLMGEHQRHQDEKYLCPHPESYAVWCVMPNEYDPESSKEGMGGTIFPCLPSPPMCAIDKHQRCWVAQDRSPKLACIDPASNTIMQLDVPFPSYQCLSKATGPGIGISPDGTVWCALLGAESGVIRVNPDTKEVRLYEFGRSQWAKSFRIIHFDFDIVEGSDKKKRNFMYALSSSLLDHGAINAVMVLRFDESWDKVLGKKIVPLPTQGCACHRIDVIGKELADPTKRSLVVTELSQSKLVQLQTHSLVMDTTLGEIVDPPCVASPFETRIYFDKDDSYEKAEATKSRVKGPAPAQLPQPQIAPGAKETVAVVPGSSIEGVYRDPNHSVEGSLAGTRMISASTGDKPSEVLTLIGSDDGKSFWTVRGKFKDRVKGSVEIDFSSKGGPANVQGTYANGKLTWGDGNSWSKLASATDLDVLFEPSLQQPGGLYHDPNHYKVGSFEGSRYVATQGSEITIIICNDGVSFMTVRGKVTPSTGDIDMDFSVLPGGPKSLTAKYSDGRINWANGHCFFNIHNEGRKVYKYLDAFGDGDGTLSKKEAVTAMAAPPFLQQFPFLAPMQKAPKKYLAEEGALSDTLGDTLDVADMTGLLMAIVELLDHDGDATLLHPAPAITHFVPSGKDREPLMMVEARLPNAAETHEVYFDQATRYAFVAQMSESVLVRIHIDQNGFLSDHQDAWYFGVVDPSTGKGLSGLHNISQSYLYPGFMWVTLQFANLCILVDCETMQTRLAIKVPTRQTLSNGSKVKIGGPHCVRECPKTGDIWVALKGPVPCNPILGVEDVGEHEGGRAAREESLKRPCCKPDDLEKFMHKHHQHETKEYDAPLPDAFAVWRVNPKQYDPSSGEARGGTLWAVEASPPMVAVDSSGNCWVAQDRTPKVAVVDISTGVLTQIDVPTFETNCLSNATGPGIARAPDGGVWCALLGADAALLRCDPNSRKVAVYEFGRELWSQALRMIHFDFDIIEVVEGGVKTNMNYIYCLASSLCDHNAINALVVLLMDCTWTHVTARRIIPLPTQNCACHRVAVVGRDRDPHERAVVITELSTSRLLEVKTHSLRMKTHLVEHMVPASKDQPYDRHVYMDPTEEHNVALLAAALKQGGPENAMRKLTQR